MNIEDVTFEDFVSFFPEIEFPITLTESSAKDFSLHNKALPAIFIEKFIKEQEDEEWGELSEIVPCFKFENTGEITALVFWKASLQNYEYILTTYDREGDFIDGKVIAGLVFNDKSIIRSVCTIDSDWIINVVVGEENLQTGGLDKDPQKFSFELIATGEIIFSLNDNNL